MMITFLSMGGMPHYLGFMPKMIMVYCFILNNNLFCCFILLVSALMVMFFYLRVVFTGLMINSVSGKHINYLSNSLLFMFGVISLMGLMVMFMTSLYF